MSDNNFINLSNVTFSYWRNDNNIFNDGNGSGKGNADGNRDGSGGGNKHAGGNNDGNGGGKGNAGGNRDGNDGNGGDALFDRDKAVEDVSLSIGKGDFIVFLGRNGSGKSTLAKLLNALLIPDTGTVTVKGMDTSDPRYLWEIRRTSGMVFQNPDYQIVGTTVEEDVAFGVENLGVPSPEIRSRIDASMEATGVLEMADRPPYQLSGGQKQRVAIAGILAMKPECVILDEATSMLDPDGRREVLDLIRKLNREENIAVILITHHMDEAALADMIFVVDEGRVVMSCAPGELFGNSRMTRAIGLGVPQITEIFDILRERGFMCLPRGITGVDGAYNALAPLLSGKKAI